MVTIDHKKEFRCFYTSSSKHPVVVEIPKMKYLMIDGKGTPEEQDFQDATKTIFTISYILKFLIYGKREINYKVMPLEVKWYLDRDNKKFNWTMLIMQPDFITKEDYLNAINQAEVKQKKVQLEHLRFSSLEKSRFVQMLHRGSYQQMNSTLKIMKEYANKQEIACENDTHDIYLNDIRRTRIENLKTIMRLKIIE
jgi:hypothetical protein